MIVILLIFYTACSNERIEQIPPEMNIHFGVFTNSSRILVENAEDLEGFRVWGWRTNYGTDVPVNEFDGIMVSFDKATSIWNYSPLIPWMLHNKYKFYALHPDSISGVFYNVHGKLTIPRLDIRQSNEYTVTTAVDLMRANKDEEVNDLPPENVALTFSHMLTNVNIDLKKHENNAKDTMEVTYILLNGMNCVGSMQDDVWSLSEPSYLWDKLDIPQTLSNNASPCFSNVLMLPQVIEENQVTLYVVYSYQQAGGTTMTKMLETSLPAGEWKAGEKIVYTGTIQVDNSIVFDTPQVESWGTEQVGGTIIIQ